MTRIPQKTSLVAQTAAILREQILSGEWHKVLPSERELCSQWRVARMTLRRALARLEKERLIRTRQGKRRVVIHRPRAPEPQASRRVVLLERVPVQFQPPFDAYWTNELRLALEAAGYHAELRNDRVYFGRGFASALSTLMEELRPCGWVLANSNYEMQEWFSRRKLPCVIVGSRHPGVQLPFVDKAFRAVCRHAAGLLLARGHEQLVLVNPDSGAAGDLESEHGFNEGIAQSHRPNVQAEIVRHDGTVSDICNRLDALLRRRPAPTALLVSRSIHVLTVMGHLLRNGIKVPEKVAVISRDGDSFLEHFVPNVARYVVSPETMGHRISAAVLSMLNSGGAATADSQIMPEFTDGETLGPPRPSA